MWGTARTGCALWRSRPTSSGVACWTPATRMRVPTLRSPRPGRGESRRGLWIEPASHRLRSPRLPLRLPSGPPRWPRPEIGRSPPMRSLPGSSLRRPHTVAPIWSRPTSRVTRRTPARHAPAPLRTSLRKRAALRREPGMRGPRRRLRGHARTWLRSRCVPAIAGGRCGSRAASAAGPWPRAPGGPPAAREGARRFARGLSRGTLRLALERLESNGEVNRRQGSGTFVGTGGDASRLQRGPRGPRVLCIAWHAARASG